MAKFRFTLAPLLKQRELEEQQAQRSLGEIQREKDHLLDDLRQMQHNISSSRSQLGQALQGQVDMSQVGAVARYALQARGIAQTRVHSLARIEKRLEAARQILVEASRKRKALELLRDKQYRLWQRKRDRLEAAEQDELATQQFARRTEVT